MRSSFLQEKMEKIKIKNYLSQSLLNEVKFPTSFAGETAVRPEDVAIPFK